MISPDWLATLQENYTCCRLCPQLCRVNRATGEKGQCRCSTSMAIAHIGLHQGEEPPVSGYNGSGTVFFVNCNLRCVFCQNHQISQPEPDHKWPAYSATRLAQQLLILQTRKAHNINLVSPSHHLPAIMESVLMAREKGLNIPVLYNSNGFDRVETLIQLRGQIDLYLPDIKYADAHLASQYSGALDYPSINRQAITEMFNQVGPLTVSDDEIAVRGLVVRHLVLPNNQASSIDCLTFLARLSTDIPISLMSQYAPLHFAENYPEISRRVTTQEYDAVVECALDLGFTNLYTQDPESAAIYVPDFHHSHPFTMTTASSTGSV